MKRVYKVIAIVITFVLFICASNNSAIGMPKDVQCGYGSSGIINCEKYLKNKYKGEVTQVESKSLNMLDMTQRKFKKNVGNCVIVAITRVVEYYARNGYFNIELRDPYEIYDIVEDIAAKKCGYKKEKGGVNVLGLKKILKHVLEFCGSKKNICKQKNFIWNFKKHIKKEIDKKRPIILCNGKKDSWYKKHAVTICGYKIYNVRKKIGGVLINKKYPMIEVYDGWSSKVRYIDYRAFRKEKQKFLFTLNISK